MAFWRDNLSNGSVVQEILDEREKVATHRVKMAKSFKAFVLEGDLDAGLRLLADSDDVQAKHAKKLHALAASQGGADAEDADVEKDPFELAADDAWIIANKVHPPPPPDTHAHAAALTPLGHRPPPVR